MTEIQLLSALMDHIKTSQHTVSITEAGANNQLRPVVLLNLLQDIAEEHASQIGIGVEDIGQKGFAWFAARYQTRHNASPSRNLLVQVHLPSEQLADLCPRHKRRSV